jgi:cell wall-associated NlpC family hydrolase
MRCQTSLGFDLDRRLTPFSGRVALDSLRGHMDAPAFTAGEPAAVALPLVDLMTRPAGARDRQLPLGAALTVVDRQDGWAFVQASKDGYCGWLPDAAIGAAITPTHWVTAPASHAYAAPKVQAPDRFALPMGASLTVTATEGAFAATQAGFVPLAHLRPIGGYFDDPAEVALMFLHSPYLWGGNSHAGLDCSGLVQIAFHACGRECPGDSDLQQAVGQPLSEDAPSRCNDLIFWKGHVALMLDATRLIHANGHSMSVALESLDAATNRIAAQGGGPITARRRP